MAEASPRFALPYLQAAQAQKEVFHNEALGALDALVHAAAVSASITAPPATPAAGQCWLIPAGASGLWSGKTGQIAAWGEGGWRFHMPVEGMRLFIIDAGVTSLFASGVWSTEGGRADGYYVSGIKVVGAQQASIAAPAGGSIVDSESRAVLGAILTAMRAHGLIAAS